MIEKGSIFNNYKLEIKDDCLTQQTLCLMDSENETVAQHIIYFLSKDFAQKHFSQKNHKFFESASLPFYTGRIESNINGIGIGLELFKYGEKYLYKNCNKPYYRFIQDVSKTHWTERHLPEILEDLEENLIPVEIIIEEVNEKNQYLCVLLFKDNNSLDEMELT